MTLDLSQIERRAEAASIGMGDWKPCVERDIPALLAEVRALRGALEETTETADYERLFDAIMQRKNP